MAATGAYVTHADVTRRISEAIVIEVFDDTGTGVLDAEGDAAEQDCILDAESDLEDHIRRIYGAGGLDWLRDQGTSAPRSIKRIVLDLFEIRCGIRHPQYIRGDWVMRDKRVRAQLEQLRVREIEIATASSSDTIEPAITDGSTVRSGDPDSTTPKDKVFLDGLGTF